MGLSKLGKKIRERSYEDMKYITQCHLYNDGSNVKNFIFPGNKSCEISKKFFDDKILPQYFKDKPLKKDKKQKDFLCIIANLKYASINKPLIVSLSSNDYKGIIFPSRYTLHLVKNLYHNGYIELKKGFFDHENPDNSRYTRIWPKKKLIEELFNHNEIAQEKFQIIENKKLVILRNDDKKKSSKKYRETKYTKQLQEDIAKINEVNRRFSIKHEHEDREAIRLTSDLHAVFNNGTFKNGGRFYTGKNGYQGLFREGRQEVTINGNKTIELDYGGLHPHILYAQVGIQAEGDQYEKVCPDKKLRPVLKKALLALLNADSETKMVRAGNEFLHQNYEIYKIMKEKHLTIKDLIKLFKISHASIAHFFCTGQGVKLMNIDSEIARIIMLKFASENMACLCIHDSFIVEKQNEQMLKELMLETYQNVISEKFPHKKLFTCPVKRAF